MAAVADAPFDVAGLRRAADALTVPGSLPEAWPGCIAMDEDRDRYVATLREDEDVQLWAGAAAGLPTSAVAVWGAIVTHVAVPVEVMDDAREQLHAAASEIQRLRTELGLAQRAERLERQQAARDVRLGAGGRVRRG